MSTKIETIGGADVEHAASELLAACSDDEMRPEAVLVISLIEGGHAFKLYGEAASSRIVFACLDALRDFLPAKDD